MPFPFTCPNCRHPSQVLDQLAGTQAQCPMCGVVVSIPSVRLVRSQRAATPTGDIEQGDWGHEVSPVSPRQGGGGVIIVVLLLLGGFLALSCCGGLGVAAYFLAGTSTTVVANLSSTSDDDATDDPANPVATRPARTRSQPSDTDSATAHQVYRKLLRSTPWLIAGDGQRVPVGSGVVIDRNERLVLANYHAVIKFDKILAVFPDFRGEEPITAPNHYYDSDVGIPAHLIASDSSRDLVLLQLDRLPLGVEAVRLAPSSASAGQSVHTIGAAEQIMGTGNEEGMLWRYNSRRVKQVRELSHTYGNEHRVTAWIVELSLEQDPNDSGGPVVDDRGRLLAVTNAFNLADTQSRAAIDVREVRSFLVNYFARIGRVFDGGMPLGAGPAAMLDEDNELPAYWVQVLKQPSVTNVEKARMRLARMGRAGVLELRKALRDSDPKLRAESALVLGRIGDDAAEAIDDLVKALADADATVRTNAAQALGKFGAKAHRALVPLIRLTADANAEVRSAAVGSLGKIGPPDRADVAEIVALWNESDRAKRATWLATVRGLKSPVAIQGDLFTPLLKDPDKAIQLAAVEAIDQAGPPAHAVAYAPLMALSLDGDEAMRRAVLAALTRLGPATAADRRALEIGVRSSDADIRLFCVAQIGNLGSEARSVVPDVARLLRDGNPKVRTAAARTLGRVGKVAIVVVDELLLVRHDPEPAVRSAVLEALGRISREPHVVTVLFDPLNDRDSGVREAAASALKGLTPPLSERDLTPLRAALRSPRVEARRFAASEIARLGMSAEAAIPDVLDSLNDPDFIVCRHLVAALATYGPKARGAVPSLVKRMEEIFGKDSDKEGAPELFRQAVITLTRLGEVGQVVPILTKGLKKAPLALRREAVIALGEIGASARPAAQVIVSQLRENEVRPAAVEALVKIGGDKVVRAISDEIDEGTSMPAKLAAISVARQMGPDAHNAYQALFKASNRYRGKEVGEAAREALKAITKE